jgi:hypothetical protein
MFVRMRKIHVRNDERPWKLSSPFRTPSHVSWTTSSATAAVETYIRATRSIEGCKRSTSIMNAASSPARSSCTSAMSSVRGVDALTGSEPSGRRIVREGG